MEKEQQLAFIFCYKDDSLESSPTINDHEQHLWEVFTRLCENNLMVNLDKCVLAKPTVTFLCHMVDSKRIRLLPENVATIQQFPPPTSKLDVQRLLGMCHFYHQFLSCLAHIVRPLTDYLATTKREFTVTEDMLQSVLAIKNILFNACMLVHPIRNTMLPITTDASDIAIGEILHQHHHGHLQPLTFFSRKLNDAELNYSAFDRELLTVAPAIKHFQHSIEGRQVIVYTDQAPLLINLPES